MPDLFPCIQATLGAGEESMREVSANTTAVGNSGIQAGLSHLNGIDYRKSRLVLERLRTPIPELRVVVKRVENCWSVALASETLDADRNGSPISEREGRIVARTAGNGTINRQTTIEEQLFAQSDFF